MRRRLAYWAYLGAVVALGVLIALARPYPVF